MRLLLVFLLFAITSCSYHPRSVSWNERYSYLRQPKPPKQKFCKSSHTLFVMVAAPHLDYGSTERLLCTMSKHPRNGAMDGSVGHAWLAIEGPDGWIEGGHSGELGTHEKTYLDGVMEGIEKGSSNPSSYLRKTLRDGFFQRGSGGHEPSYVVACTLTEEQYHALVCYMQNYDYESYNLSNHQCVSYVVGALAIAGVDISVGEEIWIDSYLRCGGECWQLWSDPEYQWLRIQSPDFLEKELVQAVHEGCLVEVRSYYNRKYFTQKRSRLSLYDLFGRTYRHLFFRCR